MFGPVPGLDTCPGLGSGSNPVVVFLLGSEEEGGVGLGGFPMATPSFVGWFGPGRRFGPGRWFRVPLLPLTQLKLRCSVRVAGERLKQVSGGKRQLREP